MLLLWRCGGATSAGGRSGTVWPAYSSKRLNKLESGQKCKIKKLVASRGKKTVEATAARYERS